MSNEDSCSDAALLAAAVELAAWAGSRGEMLATAESCTGGWIAKALTDVAGSSGWFLGGVVSYSNALKQALLGVREATLAAHGAVSREVAEEMVAGVLARTGATLAVAVTGIAGPGGGSPGKPVGTVWVAWRRVGGDPVAECCLFAGDREAVRRQTVARALAGLRRFPTGSGGEAR